MDTQLTPGISSWNLAQGQNYRLSGILKGGISDQTVQAALTAAGFPSLNYYSTNPPLDWPIEDLTPLSPGDRIFRADGTWVKNTPLTTAIILPNGSFIIIEQVWAHNNNVQPVVLSYSDAAVSPALPQTQDRLLFMAGAAISLLAAGYCVGIAVKGR